MSWEREEPPGYGARPGHGARPGYGAGPGYGQGQGGGQGYGYDEYGYGQGEQPPSQQQQQQQYSYGSGPGQYAAPYPPQYAEPGVAAYAPPRAADTSPLPVVEEWGVTAQPQGATATAVDSPPEERQEPAPVSAAGADTPVRPAGPGTDPGAPRTQSRSQPQEGAPAPRAKVRDRYFDSLRAVALIRVVTYHTFGWAWCGMVFPSMGIMFGLAGTLMAKSLERPAGKVIRSRVRRLLPPFWFWGIFVVLAMMIHDWIPGWQFVFWIVPLGDPPGNAWGQQAWEILWYLRTYLWFVLLSPGLLWLFRKAPVPVLLLTLAPVVVLQFVWDPGYSRFGSALWDIATYLFCWVLGFAHRDGVLERMKPALVVALSVAALGFGGWYAFSHEAALGTYDLDEIPLAQAFWSAGFVMLLMWAKARFRIDFAWLTRYRRLDRTVTIFNARAVTIYLWHEIALVLAVPLIDQFWNVPAFEKYLPLNSQWFMFGIGWILIVVFVLLCGWVEDVAGKKKPKLLP